ncbi:hypothetical protein AWC38_SpisGene2709 [Stylophora pistillata]|uniref:Uncharacterized protein n=1 Tax=Stylophora pistillata TaxID=50429 RepID=A0A2B4STI0_STYPI|nr:hypothetical protein AWC38_SpisGene2709 [Stylophora pistillata]
MRLLRFDFAIEHVPGKALYTADSLSRSTQDNEAPASKSWNDLHDEVECYVNSVLVTLPASDQRLDEIRREMNNDDASNGEVERAVQTMKRIMNKSSDEYLALLTYIDTPLHNGYSPAQLSMGRKLRTRIPCHVDELLPQTPDHDQVKKKEREYRTKIKSYYDHRHRVDEGEELFPGDRVCIPDMKVEGTVIKPHERPRSVVFQTPNGKVRRNRRMTRRAPKDGPRSSFALRSRDSPEPFMRHGPVTELPTYFAAIQDSPVPDFPDIPDAIREASRHLPTPLGNQTVEYKSSQTEAWSNRLRPRGVIERPQRYVEEY